MAVRRPAKDIRPAHTNAAGRTFTPAGLFSKLYAEEIDAIRGSLVDGVWGIDCYELWIAGTQRITNDGTASLTQATLANAPTLPSHATTKSYVDAAIAAYAGFVKLQGVTPTMQTGNVWIDGEVNFGANTATDVMQLGRSYGLAYLSEDLSAGYALSGMYVRDAFTSSNTEVGYVGLTVIASLQAAAVRAHQITLQDTGVAPKETLLGLGLLQIDVTGSDQIKLVSDGVTANAGLWVGGKRVCGPQQAHVAAPSGGGTQDAEARTAIGSIISILETHGLAAAV